MNDKQQLAAMGEHMAEQAAQPMCMAKRIEELEAQVRVMAGLLREAQECVVHDVVRGMGRDVESLWARIDATLAGQVTEPAVIEGWVSVPYIPTPEMRAAFHKADDEWEDGYAFDDNGNRHDSPVYQWVAMLNAAPKPEGGA